MTLVLKPYYHPFFTTSIEPYKLGGVKDITSKTKYGGEYFAITIFDTRVFRTCEFEYVKDAGSGKVYIENGKWVAEDE